MKTTIRIRGRTYTVRSDEGEGDLSAVAADLDRRMQEIARTARGLDEYTIAMLTALNLASELHRWRGTVDTELHAMEREIASLAVVVDAALPPEPEEGDGA